MKNLVSILFILSCSTVFANPHIIYSEEALQLADNDVCVGVAVDTVINHLMAKMDDPSDLDTLNVTKIKIVKRAAAYEITAGVNSGKAKKIAVDVCCWGFIK